MTHIEYLLVLLSIIIGLALAELLGGIARLIRDGAGVRLSAFHGLLVLNAFLFLLQFWWNFWSWREVSEWTPAGMVILVIGSTALYLLAYLCFPNELRGANLRAYYWNKARVAWSMVALYMLGSLVSSRVILGYPWRLDASTLSLAGGIAVMLTLAISRSRWVHAPLVALVTGINVIVLFG